ncbi:hypothetical protein Ciccas_011144, partial [Cichlidogyrus casuarinus]
MQYQHPISGLFPLHPDDKTSNISHVRENVYCATLLWAMRQAYVRLDDDQGRSFEMGHCAVKCMRTILLAWMRQSSRLENFKTQQNLSTCLHTQLSYDRGECVYWTDYKNLQLDCIGLYVLQLVQMISSGLQVIYTKVECAFVQNLIFYLERAYRIPDYGMWERGSKQNRNVTELHASSIGMAKAALEAASGFNIFGAQGDHSSVVYIDIDAHSRNRIIMSNLLPRESSSKGTDSALIPTICWPAYATHSDPLHGPTLDRCIKRLQQHYGFKRFICDGQFSVLDRPGEYEPGILKEFQNIECEWPIFHSYLVIYYCLKGLYDKAEEHAEFARSLLVELPEEVYPWMPKYYYVPEESLDKARSTVTVERLNSFEKHTESKFLWGQAVYLISRLVRQFDLTSKPTQEGFFYDAPVQVSWSREALTETEGFSERFSLDQDTWTVTDCIRPHELDPVGRHHRMDGVSGTSQQRYAVMQNKPENVIIQVPIISESVRLQQLLLTYGIQTQTPHQIEPITVAPPDQLMKIGKYLGKCDALGLTGRPLRPIGQLGTSKFYRFAGRTILCYPLMFEAQDFYLMHDTQVLINEIKSEFAFLTKWWRMKGRPTFCLLLREDMMKGPQADQLIPFLVSIRNGNVHGSKIVLGRIQNFVNSGCVDHLDYLPSQFMKFHDFLSIHQLDSGFSFQDLLEPKGEPLSQKITPSEPLQASTCLLSPALISAASAVGVVEALNMERLESHSEEELMKLLAQDVPLEQLKEYLAEGLERTFLNVFDQMNPLHLSLAVQAASLGVLRGRHGLEYQVSALDMSVRECFANLSRKAALNHVWAVIRFCSSMLEQLVTSLAPSLSAILVLGKQITLGLARGNETAVYKPLNPSELQAVLFSTIFPSDPIQLSLQQELILWTSNILSADKKLFDGISVIRMGWIVEALKLKLESEIHNTDEIRLAALVSHGSESQLEDKACMCDSSRVESFANLAGEPQMPHCEASGDLAFICALNKGNKEHSARHSLGACRLYALPPTEVKSLLLRTLKHGLELQSWKAASPTTNTSEEELS